MVTLDQDQLLFWFPDIESRAVLVVEFQRTLRIPDDGRHYPLPPGLGRFPLSHVEDHAGRLPASWLKRGGVFLPMHQAEALWINFHSPEEYPFAVKVGAGKVNAVTGNTWSNELSDSPQDYLVAPPQPWLDGFCVKKGVIRQFVAMPLGEGYTAEEQLTGAAEHGGLQLLVYPMKAEWYRLVVLSSRVTQLTERFEGVTERLHDLHNTAERLRAEQQRLLSEVAGLHVELLRLVRDLRPDLQGSRWEQMLQDISRTLEAWRQEELPSLVERRRAAVEWVSPRASIEGLFQYCRTLGHDLGLAPGGRMRQEVYEDPYGLEAWETGARGRCFVHLLNSLQYLALTGSAPPDEPPTAEAYTKAGLPWFDYYAADQKALEGAAKLAGLKSVAALRRQRGEADLAGEQPVAPANVRRLSRKGRPVREPAEEADTDEES